MQNVRDLVTTLAFLLPWYRLKVRLLNWVGHEIHPSARIGICLVRHVKFEVGEDVIIGHFNVFGGFRRVQMARESKIAYFNFFMAGVSGADIDPTEDEHVAEMRGTLRLEARARVVSFHTFDCSGGVLLGEESTVTGMRCLFLSHAFDPTGEGVIVEPILVGRRSIVSTSCTLLSGSVVGDGALLAAGSTLWTRQKAAAESLLGGVPARRLSPITIADWVYDW